MSPVVGGTGRGRVVKVSPFLLFDGNRAEAMEFYRGCLDGESSMVWLGETRMKDHMAPEMHAKAVNAHLKCGVIEFFATDWLHPTRKAKPGNTVRMYLSGGIYDELPKGFDGLAVEGDEALIDNLRNVPFGSCRHLSDRFELHWFFQEEECGRGCSPSDSCGTERVRDSYILTVPE